MASKVERAVKALVPLTIFSPKSPLYPANMEILNGGGISLRALAPGRDGAILRSKEYILFGYGLGTLMFDNCVTLNDGYVLKFCKCRNKRGVYYWVAEADASAGLVRWTLRVSYEEPFDDCGHVIPLSYQPSLLSGHRGQFIYLHCHDN